MRDMAVLDRAPLYTFNEFELDAYLRALAASSQRHPALTPTQRVAMLARKNVGQPYRLFLLGEYPFELIDPDPMVCLSAGDCVTFVEHTYAMALSHDWPSFFRTLQRIRYRNGIVGYRTRNHFMEADWNIHNAWLFDDITARLAGDGARPLRVRVDRATFFAKAGLDENIPVEVFEGVFLPRDRLPGVAAGLRDGDVIEFVRGGERWQYVGHIGLVAKDGDGTVMLIHATKPAVAIEPMAGYLNRHPDVLGVLVLRMKGKGGKRGQATLSPEISFCPRDQSR